MRGEQGQGGYNHGIAILGQRSGSHREARQRQGRATEARGHGSNEHVIRRSLCIKSNLRVIYLADESVPPARARAWVESIGLFEGRIDA